MVKKWPARLVHNIRLRARGAFFAVGTMGVSAALLLAPVTPVFAASISDAAKSSSSYGSNTSTCAIQTVGWVVCPTMRSIAMLADYGFAFINQNFLKIESGISNTKSGVYKAWEVMRTIANALFVLAFMAIVYAQITGRSAGGYNIKRMLPRLIVGAILVNVSYFVCAIGVEVSNIIGNSILAVMQGIADQIGTAAMSLDSAKNGFDDSRLTDITNAVLQKAGTVWILLAPVGAVTVSIAVICGAGLVLLIMRKVVVGMLMLASPLMFVAYLLPNTEHYFQQWLRLLFQLLLLYPIIAFLLGTGQIISATVMSTGSSSDSNYRVKDDSYQGRNGGSGSATTDLAAAGAAVLPLLGTWFLLKSLSSFVTNAGTKVAGNIARRGKNDEEKIKAQMDSKAKQAAAGAGSGLPTYDRRPAFSRLRRRAARSHSDTSRKPGGASSGANGGAGEGASLFDRALGVGSMAGGSDKAATEAAKQQQAKEEASNANNNANVSGAVQAQLAGGKEPEKKKTAKDIFNNLNKTRQMGGGGSGGGGNGGGGGGGQQPSHQTASAPPAPSVPVVTHAVSAPQAAPSAPATPQAIVAVPVQVDASAFLHNTGSGPAGPGQGMAHVPANDVTNKATERANKYLFKAQNEVQKSSDRLDALKEIRDEQRQVEEKAKRNNPDTEDKR